MKLRDCMQFIKSDLDRLPTSGRLKIIKGLFFNASFKITFWFRIGSYLKTKCGVWKILYYIVYLIHRKHQLQTGIQLPLGTKIDTGLCFSHYSCVVINDKAQIGKNFTMFQGCTIGSTRGAGVPIIGDNVVMSAGSKVIGNVKVGNNVMIGAGAVVVKDVPDNAVVVGVPAKVKNYNGRDIVQLYYIN